MLHLIVRKELCTGCEACLAACPVDCIAMAVDEEGFRYPEANPDECIHCGKCERVCPIRNDRVATERDVPPEAIAAVTRSHRIWKASTSGGAFTEICHAFGDSETVVFGARFDGLNVVHSHVIGVQNIAPFRKSKCVESDLQGCLADVKRFLDQGKKVIFSGAPCQIAGLSSFLGGVPDNLLLVDFICHGVGSPSVFRAVLEHTGSIEKKRIVSYSFRNQVGVFGNILDSVGGFTYEDGSRQYVFKDLYYRLFLTGLCLRPSCSRDCKFPHAQRISDITLADLRGKHALLPNDRNYRNYSTVILNSRKGHALRRGLERRMNMFPISAADVSRFNPHYTERIPGNPRRDAFFASFVSCDRKALFDEYYQLGKPGAVLLRSWKNVIPYWLKSTLKSLLRRKS
jgi:ferredoxin